MVSSEPEYSEDALGAFGFNSAARLIQATPGSSENESSESDESEFDQVEATTEKEIEGDFKCVSC